MWLRSRCECTEFKKAFSLKSASSGCCCLVAVHKLARRFTFVAVRRRSRPRGGKTHFVLLNRFEFGDAGALKSERGGWKAQRRAECLEPFDGKAS